MEQKIADVVTTTNHTEYATKEDIKQLKVDMAQMIQAMLQQLLGAGATKAILQPDSGDLSSARGIPERDPHGHTVNNVMMPDTAKALSISTQSDASNPAEAAVSSMHQGTESVVSAHVL